MKTIAILQSNYIPWKGYFDLINAVDEFIIYDDVQYTKRDWRNRNKIKTNQGVKWLTIPVITKRKYLQKINETKIRDNNWAKKHWKTIVQNYSNSTYFKEYKTVFEEAYLNDSHELLSIINYKFIVIICNILGITTKIRFSSEFKLAGNKTEKLLSICKKCNANAYLSGSAAKVYLDQDLFKEHNIQIKWMDYSGYEEYSQLFPPFEHYVSILDLIFNEGNKAKKYMKINNND